MKVGTNIAVRRLLTVLVLSVTPATAGAHFVFVVPTAAGTAAQIMLSEDLKPDEGVDIGLIKSSKLFLRDSAGTITPVLAMTPGEHSFGLSLTGEGSRVVYGETDLGVSEREGKTFLLIYHPKTVVGDPFDAKTTVGNVSIEIIPRGRAGDMRFEVVANGKPLPKGEVTVLLPDGSQKKVPTDDRGLTEVFAAAGRYGAWARSFDSTPGKREGKPYGQVRHYATLVIDVPGAAAGTVAPSFAAMPEAKSSFGAVVCDGWLYVYGGHISRTHSYSTESMSGKFHRLNLADGKTWEQLPGGPTVQGMNLATYGGKVYRVGGMEAHNKPEDKSDTYSVASVACFDPATGKWESLPDLPKGRSSHDIAVVGSTLYVVGGWSMNGRDGGNTWLDGALAMDLAAAKPEWKLVEQPFQRRALIASAHSGKVYVMGGFNEASEASRQVMVYDPVSDAWSNGPEMPGDDAMGFAPAACELAGKLYVSVGDGRLLRLNDAANTWDTVAKTTPRIVHRLTPVGNRILVIGGASKGTNYDLIESVTITGDVATPDKPADAAQTAGVKLSK